MEIEMHKAVVILSFCALIACGALHNLIRLYKLERSSNDQETD